MSKLDEFKLFVKKNPSLISYVKNNEMTWQKFYEIYDLYGTDESVWKKYLTEDEDVSTSLNLFSWLKNIDIDSLQENINSAKRVIGVLQDLGKNNKEKSEYKPRPLYKHFED